MALTSIVSGEGVPFEPEGNRVPGREIVGTRGSDDIFGGQGDDLLRGLSGDDFIEGFGGEDTIFGGAGDDYLYGGEGGDVVFGVTGDDTLVGSSGDVLSGGRGNDVYFVDTTDGILTIDESVLSDDAGQGVDVILLDIDFNDIGVLELSGNTVLFFDKTRDGNSADGTVSSGVIVADFNEIEFVVPLDLDIEIPLTDFL